MREETSSVIRTICPGCGKKIVIETFDGEHFSEEMSRRVRQVDWVCPTCEKKKKQ